jgi:hypothetical protein
MVSPLAFQKPADAVANGCRERGAKGGDLEDCGVLVSGHHCCGMNEDAFHRFEGPKKALAQEIFVSEGNHVDQSLDIVDRHAIDLELARARKGVDISR